MINVYQVKATCANGHIQTMRYKGMTKEWVEAHAALLDGTSPMYLFPPGPESMLCKCGICRAPIKCEVTEAFGLCESYDEHKGHCEHLTGHDGPHSFE